MSFTFNGLCCEKTPETTVEKYNDKSEDRMQWIEIVRLPPALNEMNEMELMSSSEQPEIETEQNHAKLKRIKMRTEQEQEPE